MWVRRVAQLFTRHVLRLFDSSPFPSRRISSKAAGKYVSTYVPLHLTNIITSSLRTSRAHTHAHTRNNTQRGRQESFHYKIIRVCLSVLERPYFPINSTPPSLLVNVQVNRKSMLLYIQESTCSNPGPETGYSDVLSWRFSCPAGKCQGSISTQVILTSVKFLLIHYSLIIL